MRHALRSLAKSPGFTAVALITLALGIGVNTSMFSVMRALLLRTLPYPESDRLVRVYRTAQQSNTWPHSTANFLDQRAHTTVFENYAAFRWGSLNLAELGQPAVRLRGMWVTRDFFPALGTPALFGRVFSADQDRSGHDRVLVLSHACWSSRFGADPGVIGRQVRINGEPLVVVGVMPPHFDDRMLWGAVDAWRPLAFSDEQRENRHVNHLHAIARLKPGVSLGQAQAAMSTFAAQLEQAHPESNRHQGLQLVPLSRSATHGGEQNVTWFVVGLAVLVLLIACTNLANLQFARTAARARDYAIRAALGASRARLVRELLTESLLLGLAGGALGLVLALWTNDFVGSRIVVTHQSGFAIPLDFRVLGFALVVSLGTGIAFGLLPAWLVSRADVNDTLRQGSRGSTGSVGQNRIRHVLIVVEVALALVLLSGAGFFVRGLQRFMERDPGWRADGLLAGYVSLSPTKYPDAAKRRAFGEQLEEKLAALPGVQRAALGGSLPTWGAYGMTSNVRVEGGPAQDRGQAPLAYATSVSPAFFETLGIRLIEGRAFTADDRADSPAVVIINETMARLLWPGKSALGRRIGGFNPADPEWREVIGVVNDARPVAAVGALDTRLQMYRPLAQAPLGFLSLALRTTGAPESLAGAVRQAVATLDPDQPVYDIAPVRLEMEQGLANVALSGWLLAGFAGLGLLLAAVGIYGVLAGFVAQRTKEIGVRLALGAQLRDVLTLVLGKGVRLALLGAVIGLAGVFAVARLLSRVAPEIPAADLGTTVAITAFLLAVATFACWLPARRAARVDPVTALRAE